MLRNPTISFNIQDDGDKNRYQWYVWVRPTRGEANSVALSGIASTAGKVEVKVNDLAVNQSAKGYSQDKPLVERGTYSFDVRVIEIGKSSTSSLGEGNVDLRSKKVVLDSHAIQYIGDERAEFGVYADYTIGDANATKVEIDYVYPSLLTKSRLAVGPGSLGSHSGVKVCELADNDPSGLYKAIFVLTDSHKSEYRDHKNRRTEAINQGTATSTIQNIWFDSVTYDSLKDYDYGLGPGGWMDYYFSLAGLNPIWRGKTNAALAVTHDAGLRLTFKPISATQQTIVGFKVTTM